MPNLLASFLGVEQWLVVLVIVLVLFGGKKIPELLRGVGRGVGELQKGLDEGKRALQAAHDEARNNETATPASHAMPQTNDVAAPTSTTTSTSVK